MTTTVTPVTPVAVTGALTYENKVIEKIVGYALEHIDGLLAVDGGFFSNLKNKVVSTDNVTDGINVEVGTKQVAVDLKVIVEYQKHVGTIFENIKRVIVEEVSKMTDLEVVEVNVTVVDIKTRAQHEADSITVQDRLENAASTTGEFASKQADHVKSAVSGTVTTIKENTEPRVV
ncbi:Asp23/Gls24 family envelope stress response protein [Streptococcus entericus]|uniref:Asp23/Gls24 family envelope stress response protein n=1 Tax=Streptococcus entericus TaxID=155680 RepID=UPI00036098F1|nr:Asp23/Gls24 family envelope stress response protein [Streptococcus entericus]